MQNLIVSLILGLSFTAQAQSPTSTSEAILEPAGSEKIAELTKVQKKVLQIQSVSNIAQSDLSSEWQNFLKTSPNAQGFTAAMEQTQPKYLQAIDKLAEKMSQCSKGKKDSAWIKNLEKQFVMEERQTLADDLRKGVVALWAEQTLKCREAAAKEALYLEASYEALSDKYVSLLQEFSKSLPSPKAKKVSQILGPIIEYRASHAAQASPLRTLLNLKSQLLVAGRGQGIAPTATQFLKAQKIFQKPFDVTTALADLEKATKGAAAATPATSAAPAAAPAGTAPAATVVTPSSPPPQNR